MIFFLIFVEISSRSLPFRGGTSGARNGKKKKVVFPIKRLAPPYFSYIVTNFSDRFPSNKEKGKEKAKKKSFFLKKKGKLSTRTTGDPAIGSSKGRPNSKWRPLFRFSFVSLVFFCCWFFFPVPFFLLSSLSGYLRRILRVGS